jgi:hypothetical protein
MSDMFDAFSEAFPDGHFEVSDLGEDTLMEIYNNGLTAAIVTVPDHLLDGWTVKIFPTLDEHRVLAAVGFEATMTKVRDAMDGVDGETTPVEAWGAAMLDICTEATMAVSTYFKSRNTHLGPSGS